MAIDLAIVHSISLPPGEFGGPAIEQLFTNTLDADAHPYFDGLRGLEVSAHFLIRRDGQTLQFVDCGQRAWHAGRSHWRGRDQCNDFSIGIELEGLEGWGFEPAQYHALRRLLKALARRYPLREVVGHEQVAPGRKRDPGPGFDWQALAQPPWPAGLQAWAPSPEAPQHPTAGPPDRATAPSTSTGTGRSSSADANANNRGTRTGST